MKTLPELTDRELQEWQYHMLERMERHLSFMHTYFTIMLVLIIAGAVSGIVFLALAMQGLGG